MEFDVWSADANEKAALQERLRRLVDDHEAFLLDEQRCSAPAHGPPSLRLAAWDARTDCLSVQVGSASLAFAEKPFLPSVSAGGDEGDEGEEYDDDDGDNGDERDGSARLDHRVFHFGDRASSFAQLLGPVSLLASSWPPQQQQQRPSNGAPVHGKHNHGSGSEEGNVFLRVLLCLSSVAAEMQALTKDAYAAYIPALALFGEDPYQRTSPSRMSGGDPAEAAGPNRGAPPGGHGGPSESPQAAAGGMSEEEAVAGVSQLLKGHLQELWAWQRRAIHVAVYALRQLAALFSEEHCEGQRSPFAPLTEVRYTAVWHGLTDLLGAITAVEEVLHQNSSFKVGYLRLRKLIAQLSALLTADSSGDGEEEEDDDGGRGWHAKFDVHDGGGRNEGTTEWPKAVDKQSLRTLQKVVIRVGEDLLRYGKPLRVIAERTALSRASEDAKEEDSGPPYAPRKAPLPPPSPSPSPSSASQRGKTVSSPSLSSAESVRFGVRLRQETREVLSYMIHNVEEAVDTPREGGYHLRIVGIFSLYHVYVSLCKLSSSSGSGGGGGGVGGGGHRAASTGGGGGGRGGNLSPSEMDACLALGKRLFRLHRRVPVVPLQGRFVFAAATWLARRMPFEVHSFLLDTPTPSPLSSPSLTGALVMAAATQELTASLERLRERKVSQLLPAVNALTTRLSAWLSDLYAIPLPDGLAPSANEGGKASASRVFVERAVLLIQRGLLLAGDLQFTLHHTLALLHHAGEEVPLALVGCLTHGVAMLMMVKEAFHAKSGVFAGSFDVLTRSISFVVEKHLHAAHVALAAKVGNPRHRDSSGCERCQLRSIEQAVFLLQRPLTPDCLLVLSLLLDTLANRRQLPTPSPASSAGQSSSSAHGNPSNNMRALPRGSPQESLITAESRDSVFMAFAQLTRIVGYQLTLKDVTSCGFLYWHRGGLYPRMFARLYERPVNAIRLPYLAAALEDAAMPLVMTAKHIRQPETALLRPYQTFSQRCLEEEVLRPLCVDVEDDLRLYTHGAVLGQPFRSMRPSAASPAAKDLAHFTRLEPFKWFGQWCDVAAVVEEHLETQFHNLNALTPTDWKTYEEMRTLAMQRYLLRVTVGEGSLPGGIVDQGLDVLVITEDVQLFVARYTLNLNEQLFVQRPTSTSAKHLHTLHTRHIANSIRTHGTGIMDTAVNRVYRCLLKKLSTVSRFLADEHVKSRLMKDLKWVEAQRKELRGAGGTNGLKSFTYPQSLAKQFLQEMRKLGLADDGQPFLAKFVRLVSEIGNALGYMRLVRSGGLRAMADSRQFLPQNGPAGGGGTARGMAAAAAGGDATSASLTRHLLMPHYLDEEDSHSSDSRSRSSSSTGSREAEEGEDGASSGVDGDSLDTESEASSAAERRRAAAKGRRRCHTATMDTVRCVDRVVQSICGRLSDGSDYYSTLMKAIGGQLGLSSTWGAPRSPTQRRRGRHRRCHSQGRKGRGEAVATERYSHLRLFYLIVPPMCVVFVEGMIREKEQLLKKSSEALFTDDGFALGCVFLLALFGVQDAFQSLRFLEGMQEHYVGELTSLHRAMMERQGPAGRGAAQRSASPLTYADNDAEEVNHMHLASSILDITLREYVQLEEAFVASSVFFSAAHSAPAAVDRDSGSSDSSTAEDDGEEEDGDGSTAEVDDEDDEDYSA